MAGAALRGMGKVLAKHLRKAPVLGKRVKGAYPAIKPSEALGIKKADWAKELKKPIPPGVKAPLGIKKTTRDIGKYGVVAGLAYAAGKAKAKKEAKAKETKEKLKKSAEEHEKKTKEKREKHGKPHA